MVFIKLLFSAYSQAITSFFFIAVVVIVYLHIQHNAQLQTLWLGILRSSQYTQLMNVILYGMIIGLTASFIIMLLGIALDYRAILIIWPLTMILMLFDLRYVSFSYAGGIVSLFNLIFGWPKLDVSALIAFIGILHLMGSLLIYLDGHRDNLPVLVEHRRFKPIGAYIMQKLWPVPLVILVTPEQWMGIGNGGGVAMPEWWPIFQAQGGTTSILLLFPIVVALGYSDISLTQTPREKTKEFGFWMGVYSLVILIMAIMSSGIVWMKYLAAIAMPALHELLIVMSKRAQIKGVPAFGAPWRGLRVLEVLPETVGEKMGIQQGDILMDINGKQVNSQTMLEDLLRDYPTFIWINVKRGEDIIELEWRDYQDGINDLGVIFVPRQTGQFFTPEDNRGVFFKILKKIKESHKQRD